VHKGTIGHISSGITIIIKVSIVRSQEFESKVGSHRIGTGAENDLI
jgi:hypothetical protein